MRIHELLFEAKPENINQSILDKLFAAYQQKDIQDNNYRSENGLEVAQHIFSTVGPSYLNWVVKQYANDGHFFLHDLPILSDQIKKFVKLTRSPTVTVERDINKYQSVNDLYTAIQSIDKIENVGGKFWRKAISGIKEFVSKGEAKVLYESPQYVIYQPLSFESSHFLEGIMTTSLCTIMREDQFKEYSARGILMYIISQDKMFNCFIQTRDHLTRTSEFTDQHNNHAFDLYWQIQHFPALKTLVKNVANPASGITVELSLEDNLENAKLRARKLIENAPYLLYSIPKHLRDKELCKIAIEYDLLVRQNSGIEEQVPEGELRLTTFQDIPDSVWDRDLVEMVMKYDVYSYEFVPERLRTPRMTAFVKNTINKEIDDSIYHLTFVPESLRDSGMYNKLINIMKEDTQDILDYITYIKISDPKFNYPVLKTALLYCTDEVFKELWTDWVPNNLVDKLRSDPQLKKRFKKFGME